MAYNTYSAGKFGKVIIGGDYSYSAYNQELAVTGWTCKLVSDDLDTTSTISQGFREFQDGLCHLEVSLDVEWNSTLHPGIAPLDLQNLPFLTGVELFVNRNAGTPYATIPLVKVSDCEVDLKVDGIVTWKLNGKSSGQYTIGQD